MENMIKNQSRFLSTNIKLISKQSRVPVLSATTRTRPGQTQQPKTSLPCGWQVPTKLPRCHLIMKLDWKWTWDSNQAHPYCMCVSQCSGLAYGATAPVTNLGETSFQLLVHSAKALSSPRLEAKARWKEFSAGAPCGWQELRSAARIAHCIQELRWGMWAS